uniref:Uncharacterized protein n=1 Tax=Arundo donax TaxID=35708 RepID=A0A0A9B4P3_ARUDO
MNISQLCSTCKPQ